MVLVDTPIWSLSLRRRAVDLSELEQQLTHNLYRLIRYRQVTLLGPIRQEVLSRIREEAQFRRIREHLRDFSNVAVDERDYEEAAWASTLCRGVRIAASLVDMLMCAVAMRYGWEIFTARPGLRTLSNHSEGGSSLNNLTFGM